jgi:hypothetical protein
MKKFNDAGYGNEDEGVFLDEARGVLGEIFSKSPIIGMPIDSISNDLWDWSETLKTNVRLCIVKQYVERGNSENVIYEIPEKHHPELDTAKIGDEHSENPKRAKITKENLNAREICKTDRRKKVFA